VFATDNTVTLITPPVDTGGGSAINKTAKHHNGGDMLDKMQFA
jgi:hypothetical protein